MGEFERHMDETSRFLVAEMARRLERVALSQLGMAEMLAGLVADDLNALNPLGSLTAGPTDSRLNLNIAEAFQ